MNIELGSLGQGNWRNLTESELEGLFNMLEKSEKTDPTKKVLNSNKKFNKALEKSDLKRDHRKANSVSKFTKKQDKQEYAAFTPPKKTSGKPKSKIKGKPKKIKKQ